MGASKYAPLAQLLADSGAEVIEMTFAEIDRVVPGGLPESAYGYRTWWTVHVGNSAQSRHGWISVGYRVCRVDLTERLVTFAKTAETATPHPTQLHGGGGLSHPAEDCRRQRP
jgi:hypothetical protein